VQAGVGELHLGLDAGHPDGAATNGPLEEVSQQLGLPDPCLTAHDQDPTAPSPGACQQLVENLALALPPEESGPRTAPRHGISPVRTLRPVW
jgi:hypothetical protein